MNFETLVKAVKANRPKVVAWLISKEGGDINPSTKDNEAIQLAAGNGRLEVVKELLLNDPRVDPSALYNDAIQLAAGNGRLEVVKLLLNDPRVDPSAGNNYAIQWASESGHVEVVKVLLNDPRVEPNADNNYALRKAIKNGHTEVVELLRAHQKEKSKEQTKKLTKTETIKIDLNSIKNITYTTKDNKQMMIITCK